MCLHVFLNFTPMNRVDRLFGILMMLQSRKYVTAERISDRFGISVRTVYRDIRALDEIGIPVSFENNKGYFIVDGYFLPPVSFTADEANALVLLSSLADRFADVSVVRNTESALEKIRTVLHSREKESASQLRDRIRVINPARNQRSMEYLADIQNSISEKCILYIEYTDLKKQKTRRDVEPIGIIYYTDQWHLIAWCWTRNDYRDFIVKQIDVLHRTQKPFRKNNHISLDEHIRSWDLPKPPAE
jgi:predicted DNA-binding transcriptional regulator YafY